MRFGLGGGSGARPGVSVVVVVVVVLGILAISGATEGISRCSRKGSVLRLELSPAAAANDSSILGPWLW